MKINITFDITDPYAIAMARAAAKIRNQTLREYLVSFIEGHIYDHALADPERSMYEVPSGVAERLRRKHHGGQ